MKKLIYLILILSIVSCEDEPIQQAAICDCEKITYQVESHRWWNEEGMPRGVQVRVDISKEYVECQEEKYEVFIGRNSTDYHNVYYDIRCNQDYYLRMECIQ